MPTFQSCTCIKIGLFEINKPNNNNMYLSPGAAAAAAATIIKKLGK